MIFSFYSYKGGVGRTQLAVNLASYLCYYQRKKILLIDWDLEAPGLHFYFEGFENVQNKGIVELFTSFVDKMQEIELEAKEEELPQLDESYIVKNVAKSSQHEGKIDLITAGFYDENYKLYNQKANAFNWKEFYDKLDGGNFIELLKKQLKALDYDYVFIDSRTGISDYSGIVNVQIPDVNVLVVAPTNQNFAGALRIAENIKNAPYIKDGNRKPIIMPILSRVDLSIENRSNDWISKFQEKFSLFIKDFCEITNTREREFLNSTILDYKRDLSFGENKLFKDKFEEINDKTLAKQYLVIAKYIQILNKEFSNESLLISNKEYLLNLIDKLEIAEVFTILDTTGSGSNNTLRNLKKEYILGNNRHDFYHRLKLYIEEFYTETQKNNLIIKDEEFNHNIRKLTWVDISQFSFVILGFNISFLTILSFLSYYVMDSLYATYITLTIYYILSILTFYFVDFGLERFFNKNFVFEKFGIFSLKMFFLVIFNFFMTFLWNFYNVYEIKYKNIIYSSYISLILILFFLYIYNLIINAIEQRRIKQNKESQSKIKWN